MRTLATCTLLIVAAVTSGCMVPSLQSLYTADTLVSEPGVVGTWHLDSSAAGFPFDGADPRSTYVISEGGSRNPLDDTGSNSSRGCYSMMVRQPDGLVTMFSLHLVKLGGQLFADVCPEVNLSSVAAQTNADYDQTYREPARTEPQSDDPPGDSSELPPGGAPGGFQPGGYREWDLAPLHNFYLIERVRPTLRFKRLNPKWLEAYLAANPGAIACSRADDEGGGLPVLTATTAELQAFLLVHVDTPEAFFGLREMLPGEPLY